MLGFALVMLMAVALAELLHRKLRAPRMLGHMITGALGWRQAAALALALPPMSSLAVLLAGNSLGWSAQLPGVVDGVLQAVLIATALSHLVGPVLTQWSLRSWARECPQTAPKGY